MKFGYFDLEERELDLMDFAGAFAIIASPASFKELSEQKCRGIVQISVLQLHDDV